MRPRRTWCRNRRYVDQIRETIDTSGAIPVSGLSPPAEEALLDALRSFRRPG
jgi:hypothetical protein